MSQKPPRFGRISSVFLDGERAEVLVSVVTGPGREPRKIKFATPRPGVWMVPKEGDLVEVHDINGTPVARFPANPPKDYGFPDGLSEGDVCIKLSPTTELHFSVQSDGTVNVDLATDGDLSVSSSGGNVAVHATDGAVDVASENGDVAVHSDTGGVTVDAPNGTTNVDGGDVVIGDGAGAVEVAVQDHDHNFSYSWTDAGGSGSGTTGVPNQPGTSTQIE